MVEYICFGILCRLLFIIWKNTPTLIFGSIFCSVMPWQSAIKTTAKSNRKLCKEDTSKKLQLHQWFLLLRKITIFLIFSIKYTDVRQEVLTSLITEWWVIGWYLRQKVFSFRISNSNCVKSYLRVGYIALLQKQDECL